VPPTPVPTVISTPNVTPNLTVNATPTPTPTPAPRFTITFTQDLTLTPAGPYYVKKGTIVVFKNDDPRNPHGIIASNVQTGQYFGGMGNMIIPYGKTLEITFDKVGAYDFNTIFQPEVQGKIVVTA
jgi:plastocyanin